MATKPDLQTPPEAVIGHELDAAALQIGDPLIHVSSYVISDRGQVILNHTTRVSLNICLQRSILDVCGYAETGSDGKRVFRLKTFLCHGELISGFESPINVVATPVVTPPLSPAPYFLTVERSLVNSNLDVEIKVSTWHANGQVAPNVLFDWRCQVAIAHE